LMARMGKQCVTCCYTQHMRSTPECSLLGMLRGHWDMSIKKTLQPGVAAHTCNPSCSGLWLEARLSKRFTWHHLCQYK
jgi:hypothetical protein